MSIVCRTVLDLRSPLAKYVSQTLLLAASWHRHCAEKTRLEIHTIGKMHPALSGMFDELGIEYPPISTGVNDDFSKTGNKIAASFEDRNKSPVLLIDNDVAFFGDISELHHLPDDAIAAAEAGNLRVTSKQWNIIHKKIGLPLMHRYFEAVNQRPAENNGRPGTSLDNESLSERPLYLNSGVVLLPSGHDHRTSWAAHQRMIHDFFQHHPLRTIAVTSSDQAGFATSVAAHGKFAWLPLRFNYRHGCFRIGLEPVERIAIVHFTGDVPQGESLNLAQRAHAYWNSHIFSKLESLPESVNTQERYRRHEIAHSILDATLSIIHDYQLERRLAAYRETAPAG